MSDFWYPGKADIKGQSHSLQAPGGYAITKAGERFLLWGPRLLKDLPNCLGEFDSCEAAKAAHADMTKAKEAA